MNLFAVLLLATASIALNVLPRRWAPLPLLAGACYMTLGQGIQILGFNFFFLRLLLLAGFLRVLVRGERPAGGVVSLDRLMILWALWAIVSSFLRADPRAILVNHLGMVYDTCGVYFLIRCFCRNKEDVVSLVKMTAVLLIPVALEMLNEQLTHRNLFAVLGGVSEEPAIRKGRLRSQGPFAHAILAGTVGAVSVPLMVGIWRRHRAAAIGGLGACLLMVVTSGSSGPLMSMILSVCALMFWRWRHLVRYLPVAAVSGYLLLELVMTAPAYFLIARVDLTGASTGWHRAELIRSSIEHLGEWWIAGTDYTRHWMPTGVSWSEDHADITNHYLAQGVHGGLALMGLFIAVVWCGFRYVASAMRSRADARVEDQFLVWSLGAALFAHAATCISVAYFDQSFLFLYLTLGLIASLRLLSKADAPAARGESQAVLSHSWYVPSVGIQEGSTK